MHARDGLMCQVHNIVGMECQGSVRGGEVAYQDKDRVPLCGTEGRVVVGCHDIGSSLKWLSTLVVVNGMC